MARKTIVAKDDPARVRSEFESILRSLALARLVDDRPNVLRDLAPKPIAHGLVDVAESALGDGEPAFAGAVLSKVCDIFPTDGFEHTAAIARIAPATGGQPRRWRQRVRSALKGDKHTGCVMRIIDATVKR